MSFGPQVTELLPWSIILIATGAMAGGTLLFEGARLTDGNMRFCRY